MHKRKDETLANIGIAIVLCIVVLIAVFMYAKTNTRTYTTAGVVHIEKDQSYVTLLPMTMDILSFFVTTTEGFTDEEEVECEVMYSVFPFADGSHYKLIKFYKKE